MGAQVAQNVVQRIDKSDRRVARLSCASGVRAISPWRVNGSSARLRVDCGTTA